MADRHDATDPWSRMDLPPAASRLHMRRVPGAGPWDMAWALDVEGHRILAILHGADNAPASRLPTFAGVSLHDVPSFDGTERMALLLVLNTVDQQDLFLRLCRDIIDAVSPARTERGAVETFVARTWRWHWLLQGGSDGRLSLEEQKGLVAEMHFLKKGLFPRLGPVAALGCWTGPLDAPKDFEIGRHAVEVKARRPGAVPHIQISSEHQLDDEGLDSLHLVVTSVTRAASNDADAATLTDLVDWLRSTTLAADAGSLEHLDRLLMAAGYDQDHDYASDLWLIGGTSCFRVQDGFPRIMPSSYPTGVGRVRYAISLPDCDRWLCDLDATLDLIAVRRAA